MMNMMYGFGGWWMLGVGMMVLFLIAILLLVELSASGRKVPLELTSVQ